MACGATLKRTIEFDPLLSPAASPKRRRCAPLSPPGPSPSKYLRMEPSPFGEVSPRLTAGGKIKIHQSIETPLCQEQVLLISQPNRLQLVEGREQILYNIKQEYKRMQKRRHLETSFQPTDPCCSSEGHPQTFIPSGPTLPGTSATSPLRKEQPLFSLRQVGMICERLLKEREDKIREEYEEILTTKLAEQYDAFVKFTHDQIMRRFGEQPASYVS
ncbi:akirin-2 isoform X1 [Xenopus laevis]|uniref:Akirin-2 n=1 Tax=Xenopus laevis TaxID=8355 RepID=A0A8J0VCG3_XENLA|nr:akirin-2 isoform X1 [Xenopus laevis]